MAIGASMTGALWVSDEVDLDGVGDGVRLPGASGRAGDRRSLGPERDRGEPFKELALDVGTHVVLSLLSVVTAADGVRGAGVAGDTHRGLEAAGGGFGDRQCEDRARGKQSDQLELEHGQGVSP